MKRLYYLLLARYRACCAFAAEVRHDDALRRLHNAERELANAEALMHQQIAALKWARTDTRNAWYAVERCDRHRALGI